MIFTVEESSSLRLGSHSKSVYAAWGLKSLSLKMSALTMCVYLTLFEVAEEQNVVKKYK